jgi:hypothetical protein
MQSHILSKFEEEEEAVTNLMHKRIETVEQVSGCICFLLFFFRFRFVNSPSGKVAVEKKAARNAGRCAAAAAVSAAASNFVVV